MVQVGILPFVCMERSKLKQVLKIKFKVFCHAKDNQIKGVI